MTIQRQNTRLLTTLLCAAMLTACGTATPDGPGPNGNNTTNNAAKNDLDPPGEVRQGSLSREEAPDVDAATLAELTAGHRDMAFSLFTQLREEEGDDANVFVSPHSIASALAMTYAGASHNTKVEMAEALSISLGDERFHRANNALAIELAARGNVATTEGQAFDLDIVNQTFGQIGFDFQEDYLDTLSQHYGAGLRLVDFVSDPEAVREAINHWVEARTRDLIVELIPEGVITPLTRFVLVNAIYFYGSWNNAFDAALTEEEPFHLTDGTTVDVPLMRQEHQFGYFADENTVAASVPYVGDQVSMILFMPADEAADFQAWEAGLTREHFDTLAGHVRYTDTVMLYMPRFTTESSFSLVDPFKNLGMIDAFDDCDADFEAMTGAPPCIPEASLYISEILHKTFVSVDEDGTEAAAATAVIMDTRDSAPAEPLVARFDRPFYYAVYDHGTETILFLGRLVDPTAD